MKNVTELLKMEFPDDHDVEAPINSTESRLAKTFAEIIRKQRHGITIYVTERHGKKQINHSYEKYFL